MARIAGINLPNNKRIVIALTYVYGIGNATAQQLVAEAGISSDTKAKDLTDAEVNTLRSLIDQKGMKVEGDLKRDTLLNIKRLKEIKSYRGHRHEIRLPLRGQRTKTNSRTMRGNVRRTAGSGKTKLQKT